MLGYDDRSNRPQSLYDLSCFVEPPHMRIAGREKPVGHGKTRRLLQRSRAATCGCIIKLLVEEMSGAQQGGQTLRDDRVGLGVASLL